MYILFFILLTSLMSRCVERPQLTPKISQLKFIGDINYPSDTKFKDVILGGLSGLTFDAKNNLLYAISDDRSDKAAARMYVYQLQLTPHSFTLTPHQIVYFKNAQSQTFAQGKVDFEGIALLPSGNLLVSSEGDFSSDAVIPPSLMEFSVGGLFVKNWIIPHKFLPTANSLQGVANNLAFEGLSLSSVGGYVFTAPESALVQDGNPSDTQKGSNTRLIRYQLSDSDQIDPLEFVYQIDPIPNPDRLPIIHGDNGLSELLALDATTLLTLERSFIAESKRNYIKIFKILLNSQTSNVNHLPSLKNQNFNPVTKELLLDLDIIIPQLNPKFPKLDNMEGMCFGPKLLNGHNTLILVSDNNFNRHQRTLFLAFEIIP